MLLQPSKLSIFTIFLPLSLRQSLRRRPEGLRTLGQVGKELVLQDQGSNVRWSSVTFFVPNGRSNAGNPGAEVAEVAEVRWQPQDVLCVWGVIQKHRHWGLCHLLSIHYMLNKSWMLSALEARSVGEDESSIGSVSAHGRVFTDGYTPQTVGCLGLWIWTLDFVGRV